MTGTVLIAAVALLIAFLGRQLWSILTFSIHQVRSHMYEDKGDELYHQIQVWLRNSGTGMQFLGSLAGGLFAGFHSTPRPYDAVVTDCGGVDARNPAVPGAGPIRRSRTRRGGYKRRIIPLILATVIFIAFFTAAGLLGAQLFLSADYEALLRNDICGFPQNYSSIGSDLDKRTSLFLTSKTAYKKATMAARSCYDTSGGEEGGVATGRGSDYSSLCGITPVTRVNTSAVYDGKCIFEQDTDVCKTDSLVLDTGALDVRDVLGINVKEAEGMTWRKRSMCVPMDVSKYIVIDNSTGESAFSASHEFQIGKLAVAVSQTSEDGYLTASFENGLPDEPYVLDPLNYAPSSNPDDILTNFVPIDSLTPSSADLSIAALRTGAVFYTPVEDPWFNITDGPDGNDQYVAADLISFLGCHQQYQLCLDSSPSSCTILGGISQISPSNSTAVLPNATKKQRRILELVHEALWAGQFYFAMEFLDTDVLRAKDKLLPFTGLASGNLSDAQWITEARNMMNISLAVSQRRVIDYAVPVITSPEDREIIVAPDAEEGRGLCDSILVRANGDTSFKVVPLVVLLAATALATVANWVLPKIGGWLHGRRLNGKEGMQPDFYQPWTWTSHGTLQLLRLALEGRGIGPWVGQEGDVPRLVGGGGDFVLAGGSDAMGMGGGFRVGAGVGGSSSGSGARLVTELHTLGGVDRKY
ncbi:hypothetical protein MKZ38_002358 [Zalerion maritima]|uniref:Uncharacterized protein n=1 Tax=Zalerion maritima TaxID=339359 RepID=A0AAD5WWU8_9PEZI|nr:hypothetical protein MKZ38_002358 [Zalerion maritima]